jgi:sugar phosphate permease
VPYAVDQGFSKAAAAGALGVISGMFIPGRLLMGAVADRIGWRLSLSLTNLGLAASFVWLATGSGMTVIYGFVLGYGLVQGARVPIIVGNVSHFFGLRSLGQLIGLLTGVSMMAGAMAPLAAGVVYDRSGSYLPATIVSIFCFVVAGLLILFVKPPIAGKGPV